MKNSEIKLTIIKVLQKALTGELKAFSKFSPQEIANVIITKTDFERSYKETENKKVFEVKEAMEKSIESFKFDMENELSMLGKDEKLLANFVRGKLTSYEEMLDKLNNI